MRFVFIDGEYLTYDQACIPVSDRGWRLGDGIFETIRITGGKPWQWSLHMSRLQAGLDFLSLPPLEVDPAEAAAGLIARNDIHEAILRITVTRESESVGYLPVRDNARSRLVIESVDLPPEPTQPIALFLSSFKKTPGQSLPTHIKTLQGMNSMLARMEADSHGAFDALLLNISGNIAETTSGNLFWAKDGKLHTPSLDSGILPGTTRSAIIRISPYPVIEETFVLNDLRNADEVFMTNSVRGAIRFDTFLPEEIQWKNHGITTELNLLLIEDRKVNVGFNR